MLMLQLINDTVHGEPGEDKIRYANDLADWILARQMEPGTDQKDKSKL